MRPVLCHTHKTLDTWMNKAQALCQETCTLVGTQTKDTRCRHHGNVTLVLRRRKASENRRPGRWRAPLKAASQPSPEGTLGLGSRMRLALAVGAHWSLSLCRAVQSLHQVVPYISQEEWTVLSLDCCFLAAFLSFLRSPPSWRSLNTETCSSETNIVARFKAKNGSSYVKKAMPCSLFLGTPYPIYMQCFLYF